MGHFSQFGADELSGRWIIACQACGITYDKRSKKGHQCQGTAEPQSCGASTDEWFCTETPVLDGLCIGHLGQREAGMDFEPSMGWTDGPGVRISCTAKGGITSKNGWQCKNAAVGAFASTIELCAGHMWQRQSKVPFTRNAITPGLTRDEVGQH